MDVSSHYLSFLAKGIDRNLSFWNNVGRKINWHRPFETVFDCSQNGQVSWFKEGLTNACYNALDRQVNSGHGSKIAYYYEDESGDTAQITYEELLQLVEQYTMYLRTKELLPGDKVVLYLPYTINTLALILACARAGVIFSVVFAGLSAKALATRIVDLRPKFLFSCQETTRNSKTIFLQEMAKEALMHVGPNTDTKLLLLEDLETYIHTLSPEEIYAPVEWRNSEDPLFVLYTSGSTGRPKGLVHSHGGYLSYAQYTMELLFPIEHIEARSIYWCSADIGWITGHTYGVFGPLMCGRTSFIYNGSLTVPHVGRVGELIAKYQVSHFYTAPTALRMLKEFEEQLKNYDYSSMEILGSVGEPIDPDTWHWYQKILGRGECPVVDTWWQTETGGAIMSPLPSKHNHPVPGFATSTLGGVQVALLDEKGLVIEGEGRGELVITAPFPSLARTVHNNHPFYQENYFDQRPGYFYTGDKAYRNNEGFYQIIGRIDDVINVSGHRIGAAEVESALSKHPEIRESCAIGVSDPIKGQTIICLCVLDQQHLKESSMEKLEANLFEHIKEELGSYATPKAIIFADDLPKTRSGKTMRRIVRKIFEGVKVEELGDISTLSNPSIISHLQRKIQKAFFPSALSNTEKVDSESYRV